MLLLFCFFFVAHVLHHRTPSVQRTTIPLTCPTTYPFRLVFVCVCVCVSVCVVWVDGLVINSNPSHRFYLSFKNEIQIKTETHEGDDILKYKHDIAKHKSTQRTKRRMKKKTSQFETNKMYSFLKSMAHCSVIRGAYLRCTVFQHYTKNDTRKKCGCQRDTQHTHTHTNKMAQTNTNWNSSNSFVIS